MRCPTAPIASVQLVSMCFVNHHVYQAIQRPNSGCDARWAPEQRGPSELDGRQGPITECDPLVLKSMDWADDVLASVEHVDQGMQEWCAHTRVLAPFTAAAMPPLANAQASSTALYGNSLSVNGLSASMAATGAASAQQLQAASAHNVQHAKSFQQGVRPQTQQQIQAHTVDLQEILKQAAAAHQAGSTSSCYGQRRAVATTAAPGQPPSHPPGVAAPGGGLAVRLQAVANAAVAAAAHAMHLPHHSSRYALDISATRVPAGHGQSTSSASQGSGDSACTLLRAPAAAVLDCDERLSRRSTICMDEDDDDECHERMAESRVAPCAAAFAAVKRPEPARSARSRLLCARVSVYTDISSPAALAVANTVMGSINLPGGVVYQPVHPESIEFKMGAMWHFPAFAVALGSSYFQRLLVEMPHLTRAACQCPAFANLCRGLPSDGKELPFAPDAEAYSLENTLRSTQFTCIFLATKIADQVHAYGLLRFMLSALTGQRHAVSLEQAADVELRCLEGLGWRLGPYFTGDALGDNSDKLVGLFCGC